MRSAGGTFSLICLASRADRGAFVLYGLDLFFCAMLENRSPKRPGLSTGPKTAEGRQRIREAQKKRWVS